MGSRPGARAGWPLGLALALLTAGCGRAPTQVVVVLRGGAELAGATVDVSVTGRDGTSMLPRQTLGPTSLPLEIPLVPVDGDATRRFVVDVRVTPVSGPDRALRLRGAFVPERLVRADVWLTPPPICSTAPAPGCSVRVRGPAHAEHTGSVHADRALRPTFRWDAVPGAARYELELEGACDGMSPDLCPFAGAERVSTTETAHTPSAPLAVSSTVPVGRRYVWRVRACGADGCSEWSEPRALEVGRQRTDFDGDGYADLVVGAMNATAGSTFGTGAAFRWAGGPDPSALGEPQRLGAGPCFFGDGVAAIGDTDGDGFPDLAITSSRRVEPCIAPDPPPNGPTPRLGGIVFVYRGGPGGLDADVEIASPEVDTLRFGYGVSTAGDVDRDGIVDMVIPAADRLFVHLGREDRSFVAGPVLPNPSYQPAVSCCADLDRDGRGDLVASRDGGVAVLSDGTLTVMDAPAVAPADRFSMDVATPDLDGDGDAELVVGSCAESFVEESGETWLARDPVGPFTALEPPALERNTAFYGCHVATVGDVDGDGRDDVGASAPYSVSSAADGQALIWLDDATRSLALRSSEPPDQHHGRNLAGIGDLDGDGFDDLAVGSIRRSLGSCACPGGAVDVWLGGASFGTGSADLVLENPEPSENSDFGRWIVEAHP